MRRLLRVVLTVATLITLVTGCSSSSKKTGAPISSLPATTPTTTSAVATPSTSSQATTPAASALSGTWDGHYSGGFTGTFTLMWQQSGSTLTGTIKLSTESVTVPINGTVSGNTIRFGTVGSSAITYTGSVSGGSMSGTYSVAGASGGPWSATKM